LAVSGDTITDALVSLVRLSSRLVEAQKNCVVAACLSSKILPHLIMCVHKRTNHSLTFMQMWVVQFGDAHSQHLYEPSSSK